MDSELLEPVSFDVCRALALKFSDLFSVLFAKKNQTFEILLVVRLTAFDQSFFVSFTFFFRVNIQIISAFGRGYGLEVFGIIHKHTIDCRVR